MILYADGIHRTTKALPGHEAEVGANQLVLIRTDGEYSPGSVLLPAANNHNNWRFVMPGIKLGDRADSWGKSLIKLPHEGFYALKREKVFAPDNRWQVGAIVQLGYNRAGEPLLFIAQRRAPLAENDLFFGSRGVRIEDEWLPQLTPLAWNQQDETVTAEALH